MSTVPFAPVQVGHTEFPLKATGPHPDLRLALPPSSVEKPRFRLLDGPPYANGALHLGHVLNKHLKDLLVRAAGGQGHSVTWTPRWDCHGLPVELKVEQAGTDRRDPAAFVAAARTYAQSQVHAQRATFDTLGLSADWASPVCTMDPAQQAATLRVLATLAQRGQLDVRHQPTPWCPACRSTVALAEQETKVQPRTEAVMPYEVTQGVPGGPQPGDVLLSWTTTPWTLPSHAGLVVHPAARYGAFRLPGSSVAAWVSEDAWSSLQERYPDAVWVGAPCAGESLVGVAYRTAFGTAHRVVAHASVQPGGGTGVLHAVPAFAPEDAALGQTFGWPVTQVLGEEGRFTDDAWAPLRGQKAGEPGSQAVVTALQADPTAWWTPWLQVSTVSRDVACCWRHGAPLVVRPSRQVFLTLTPVVRARAAALVDQMVFEPPMAQERLRHQMASRPDWCLSRQRTWGVPLALLLDRATQQPHPLAAVVMQRVADRVEREGVEAWWTTPPAAWLEGLPVQEADVVFVPDVVDVWFDSGALAVHQGHPADAVVEGHDQLRGWFQACVWVSAALDRPAPFTRVVTHGFVVDANGHKLAKSNGGDQATQGVPAWTTLPSDVVRLWAAMGEVGADRPWSKEAVTAAQQAYARLRNTLRFALANVSAATWATTPMPTADWARWDVADWHATHGVRERVLALVSEGRFEPAVRTALDHADQVLSRGLYARLKDRLYCAPVEGPARQAAEAALRAVAGVWLDVLAVLTPQLVAEAWPAGERPAMGPQPTPESESEWVRQAREARSAVTAAWEPQGWKGGLDRARWVGPLPAPAAWEGEEALGVGQWSPEAAPSTEAVPVVTPWGTGWLSPSPDPTCPRCRRPAPMREGEAVCAPCAGVATGVLTWRA
jgi:isoleucyl-tRNA synthetase